MNAVREDDIKQIISRIPYEMCEGKTFLITGANGFLASYLTDTLMYLKTRGIINRCRVIALCRNKEKAEHLFQEWIGDEDFYLLNQAVEDKVEYQGEINYIIHAASCSTTHLFASNPVDLMQANMIGSYQLLELARDKQIKGFLFFSSGAVYGETHGNEVRESEVNTIDFLDMKNSYAIGKRAGEALCKAYWMQYHVPAKGVRISHTYGPGIDINDGHVYSDFAKNILENTDIVIKGDGIGSRPFCYITDAVCAFFLILLVGDNGEMYNMANTDMTVTIKELADILVKEAFPERGLRVFMQKPYVKQNVHKVYVNTEKLRKLGWKPEVDLVEGFRRLINSEEDNYEMDK